jgi:GTP-binding protein HflX
VVTKTLKEIGAGSIPVLFVFNKMDLYRKNYFDEFLNEEEKLLLEFELREKWNNQSQERAVFLSAINREGIEEFREKLTEMVSALYMERYPHRKDFW